MTVEQLVHELMKLSRTAEVTVYEAPPDDFITIGKVEVADNGNQVRLHSQYAIDGNLC